MDSNEDEDISRQKSIVSKEEDKVEKLNLNKKKEDNESEREMIPKEEKSSTVDKDGSTEVNKQKVEEEQKPSKKKHKSQKTIKEENNEEKREKKNEEKKEEKEDEKNVKIEGEIEGENEIIEQDKNKKGKHPIIPYKVSESYQSELISALKKDNRLRPTYLLAPEYDDITRNIGDLDAEEREKITEEQIEHLKADKKEIEDRNYLNLYKKSALNGKTLIEDPMALFHGAEKVYIDQFYKLSDLFVICPLYFNYRISLEYCTSEKDAEKKEYTAYHLFNTKEISPSFTHNFCPNQARDIIINIFNYILDSKDKERKIQKFITIKKGYRCAISCFCACCTRPTFMIETPAEQLGKITEIRTTCDPILNITNINNEVIYVLRANCANWGYCCRDQCCDNRKCAKCIFTIYDGAAENKLGFISKDHRSGKRIKPDYDQLIVTFPATASCQDKVLLMCSAIVIEYLYFQNMSNSKRCNGIPKFINAFSY